MIIYRCYRVRRRIPHQAKFTVNAMCGALKLTERLQSREEVAAEELDLALETRARMHRAGAPYWPVYPTVGRLLPGESIAYH